MLTRIHSKKLEERWGYCDELEGGDEGTAHLQVALGMLKAHQHVRL